ncbi:MAG TPA: undecaprenyl-phosphate glucose phosphotransferase [Stellaceae bacterium]|jgi:Undecaprenyl-phosphate glucose phosphotransferase|nr:undecaprenyl-phosphate glucose phosphotransferase [Stellaceae bacterium]
MTTYSLETATRDRVFGFKISAWSARQIADHLVSTRRSKEDGVGLVVTPNIHHIAMLRSDEAFVKAYNSAEIITCDGFPVYYYARLRDTFAPGRVTGCDIVTDIMHQPQLPEWQRLFFVLDRDVTELAVRKWAAKHGLAERIDTYIPPMGFERDPEQCQEIARRIHDHGTTLLFMAVGAPKSEIFVDTYRSLLPPCWALCIGQAVKVELGVLPKPSKIVQKLNIEWLWRTILEPRRIGPRYVGALSGFVAAIVDDLRGHPIALPPNLRSAAASGQLQPATTDMSGQAAPSFAPYSGRVSSTLLAVVEGVCKLLDLGFIFLGAEVARAICQILDIGIGTLGQRYSPLGVISALLFVGIFHVTGGYKTANLPQLSSQLSKLIMTWFGVQCFTFLEIATLLGQTTASNFFLLCWTACSLVPLWMIRTVSGRLIERWRKRGALRKFIVVVGAEETGSDIVGTLHDQPHNFQVLGVFDDRLDRVPTQLHGVKVLGRINDLIEFARRQLPDEVIVTLPVGHSNRLSNILRTLTALPVDLRLVYQLAPGFRLRNVTYIGEHPIMDIFHRPIRGWNAIYKWIEDKTLSGLGLLVISPLLLLTAIAIKLESRGPVFFTQDRFGFNNRVIKVLKFRSMYVDRGDKSGMQQTMRNDPRVTRVGRIIRKLSIDELPQLFNVLRGDMSLVGPRAHAVAMRIGEQLYNDTVEEYFARHKVRPGITGWAQVNGMRGQVTEITMAKRRVDYDLEYIEKWSIWLDIAIIFRSVSIVLFQNENAF